MVPLVARLGFSFSFGFFGLGLFGLRLCGLVLSLGLSPSTGFSLLLGPSLSASASASTSTSSGRFIGLDFRFRLVNPIRISRTIRRNASIGCL